MHAQLLLSASLLLGAANDLELDQLTVGTELVYAGNFVADRGNPADTEKTFELTLMVTDQTTDSLQVCWTLQENGRGGWSWLDRFGVAQMQRKSPGEAAGSSPALLYERTAGTSVVPVSLPIYLTGQKLEKGTSWKKGKVTHTVQSSKTIAGHPTWKVESANNYGRTRTTWVSKSLPLLVSLEQRVFIGQGEQHRLKYQLKSARQLSAAEANQTLQSFNQLAELIEGLEIAPRTREVEWSPARLKQLKAALPGIEKAAAKSILAGVLASATKDSRAQTSRTGAIEALRETAMKSSAPRPELTSLTGGEFDWSRTDNKVVLLHFWDYQDSPLEEPYGQIAYVDFLFRNLKSDQFQVYGIACSPRLRDGETRAAAIRSVKKIKSFMNLSYPVLVDKGAGIRSFGDPRTTGTKLPLFVVVDRGRRVVEYHAGNYAVDRNRGLQELHEFIEKVLDTSE